MKAEIIQIWAYGTNHRYFYIKFNDRIYKIRTSNEWYEYLKQCGVPTAQSKRNKK